MARPAATAGPPQAAAAPAGATATAAAPPAAAAAVDASSGPVVAEKAAEVTATATAETPEARPAAATAPAEPAAPAARTAAVDSVSVDASKKTGKEFVHQLLKVAKDYHASDLHILSGAKPVLRLPSGLVDLNMEPMTPELCEKALWSILQESQRKEFMRTHNLDFCYDAGPGVGRFRSNLLRQRLGVDGTFRPIPDKVPSFAELGLPEQVIKFTEYRQGIVLLTGPKGCGKTTTLAAMVDHINASLAEHIITMEDPIEFVHPCKKAHVNQREVGTHTMSFGAALRGALREAPDVIVVGEMRDLETTSLAISAAETGHLVLATLHTPNAIRTIGRVLDVFPPNQQGQIRAMLSESLRGVLSQMLVPALDGKSYEVVAEVLINTAAVANLIRDDRVFQLKGLMQTGKKVGMVLMDESLARLCREGRISREEALSRVEEREFFEQELKSHIPKAAQRCATCKKGELEYAGIVRGDLAEFFCPRCESKGAPRTIVRLKKSTSEWTED
ncbi:MAG: type IV pilus twitching motility protein PilT [Planctomycetes bacterium]|nr:type IV pilus twitching motility protein PilT [Planctomycetota bacterium]